MAFDRRSLAQAWEQVRAKDAEDDQLSAGVRTFGDEADQRLAGLAEQLAGGMYLPGVLTELVMVTEDGGQRVLRVPAVRDRVVERALLSVLSPRLDPLLGPASFGFRPGLGVVDAVQALARLRDEGFGWVLRTDLHDCFPSVDLRRVRRLLEVLTSDGDLLGVLDLLLARAARRPGEQTLRPAHGLPQGSSLSPLLANLVLEDFDDRMRHAGFPLVRYADDIAVLASSEREAWEAARVASAAAKEIGMTLGADKTEIMSFDGGFCFLGEDFGPRYPPVVELRIEVPEQRTLYAGIQGSRARIEQGRVVVEHQDAEVLDVPAGHVARIVCSGAVGVSSGLRNWALSGGVELVFCSQRGRYLGQTVSGHLGRVERLRRQLACADDPERHLPLARSIVDIKIRKQAVLLQRLTRREQARELSEAVAAMRGYAAMAPQAMSRAEVMGLEGAAARAYFQAWAAIVPELGFSGRNRRPPLAVVNSALSFGYAVLLSEAVTALAAAGMDSSVGFLHTEQDGRPSLALDLMEEFRPLVVDQVVLELVRRNRLGPQHGHRDEERGGVLLTRAGREALLDGYERRMLTVTRGALPGFAGSLRRHLYRQAQVLAAWVDGVGPGLVGLSWR
ncbi:CRISPR-associated endonuclease Cas1 [Kutzneria sp. 744]|uniref:CRISPR-associated endonuclease Cas1 n=1 Tax=Kutzneria sp. (strain 744) TaxID=345341 RepID=UPI0018DD9EDB|nr:CRISPR-associated endonuclease Cas1 [Kutzneria sp. 744]